MTQEIWKQIPGLGGHYEASSYGRIRSKDRIVIKQHSSGATMRQSYKGRNLTLTNDRGYLFVHVGVDGKRMLVGAHRLVLLAFVGEPDDGEVCRHLDGNPLNNTPANLAWGTHTENMADRKGHGNYSNGEDHAMAKLTEDQVLYVRRSPKTGKRLSELLGISQAQISRIRRGTNWSHI